MKDNFTPFFLGFLSSFDATKIWKYINFIKTPGSLFQVLFFWKEAVVKDKEYYMKLALELAKKGGGMVNPNPQVGAIIVKNDKIIGEGYHEQYGQAHAERSALSSCIESPQGADMYVTLEPCAHQGRQPPCFKAIIDNKIKRVIIGSLDPNPLVSGKGLSQLKKAGIEVIGPVLEKECKEINQIFYHFITHQTPFVMMKYAMTLDGKISTVAGKSKWITGEKAREKVHMDRARFMGIMVGVGTVIADNPKLTNRGTSLKNPIRIICDTGLRTPIESEVVATAHEFQTIIATSVKDLKAHQPYISKGCKIITVSKKKGRLNLKELMKKLGDELIDSIILEGGASLNASALEEGIVHKIQAYIAPKIFGGSTAKTPVGGEGITFPEQATQFKITSITQFGEDILLESEKV